MGVDGLHIEYLHMTEEDNRRHKSYCIYYWNGFCRIKYETCYSSSHCKVYSENIEILKQKNMLWYKQVKQREDERLIRNQKQKEFTKTQKECRNADDTKNVIKAFIKS